MESNLSRLEQKLDDLLATFEASELAKVDGLKSGNDVKDKGKEKDTEASVDGKSNS